MTACWKQDAPSVNHCYVESGSGLPMGRLASSCPSFLYTLCHQSIHQSRGQRPCEWPKPCCKYSTPGATYNQEDNIRLGPIRFVFSRHSTSITWSNSNWIDRHAKLFITLPNVPRRTAEIMARLRKRRVHTRLRKHI
jgi:hypothetical protein